MECAPLASKSQAIFKVNIIMNDLNTTTPAKPKKHYINNADFCKALVDYQTAVAKAKTDGKPKPRIPNYIGECFMKIAEGLSHKPNFINYSYRDEMVGDGIENCLMYFENFDTTKSSNAFAYFTQIIYFAFLRRIQKEKKQLYVKYKSTEQFGLLDENELMGYDDVMAKPFELYENISDFIETFEETKKRKKAIKKEKGIEKFLED
jgi:hypothetical protein